MHSARGLTKDFHFGVIRLEPSLQSIRHERNACFLLALQCTFPYDRNPPARSEQCPDRIRIVFAVPVNFFFPESGACRGHPEKKAGMSVPEAAMDEDHGTETWQDDVWLPCQFLRMQAVTEAPAVHFPADSDLGTGVLATDAGHHPTPDTRRNNVCHQATNRCLWCVSAFCPTSAMTWGFMMHATSAITGTTTAFPNCL